MTYSVKRSKIITLLWLLLWLVSPPGLAERDPGYGPLYFQGMLGVLDAGNAWTLEDPHSGEVLESDLGKLIYGGGMAQQMTRDGVFEYGFEGGGLVSWKNSNQTFYASNHVFAVSLDNDLFLVDLSFGGALSWRPLKPLRFYLGGGAAIAIGTVNIVDSSVEPPGDAPPADDIGGREWAVGVGLYARGGVEFIIRDFTFGVSVRQASTKLEFDNAGEIDLTAPQWFLTVGKRI